MAGIPIQNIMKTIIQKLDEIISHLSTNKRIWTLEEFCKYADISLAYGYQLTRSRKISFYRPFGKKIYIDRDEAIELLRKNEVKSNISNVQQATKNFQSKILNHENI